MVSPAHQPSGDPLGPEAPTWPATDSAGAAPGRPNRTVTTSRASSTTPRRRSTRPRRRSCAVPTGRPTATSTSASSTRRRSRPRGTSTATATSTTRTGRSPAAAPGSPPGPRAARASWSSCGPAGRSFSASSGARAHLLPAREARQIAVFLVERPGDQQRLRPDGGRHLRGHRAEVARLVEHRAHLEEAVEARGALRLVAPVPARRDLARVELPRVGAAVAQGAHVGGRGGQLALEQVGHDTAQVQLRPGLAPQPIERFAHRDGVFRERRAPRGRVGGGAAHQPFDESHAGGSLAHHGPIFPARGVRTHWRIRRNDVGGTGGEGVLCALSRLRIPSA